MTMRIGPMRHMPDGGALKWSIYVETGEIAIVVFSDSGEPLMTLTVCPPLGAVRCGEDEIWVKDWSENEGSVRALETAGIAHRNGLITPCGHVWATQMTLTPDAIAKKDAAFALEPGLLKLRRDAFARRTKGEA